MGIFSVDLDDANSDNDDPKTIIHARVLAGHNELKQCKAFKIEISKELMPGA